MRKNVPIQTISPDEQRFWSKVDICGPDDCWNWTAGIFDAPGCGYGAISINGYTHKAHRVSWSLNNGPIPDGMCVCHKCDNRKCVNPKHLFLGTHLDNALDKYRKNRQRIVYGDNHPGIKITVAQRAEILALLNAGTPQRLVAIKYGVSQSLISLVKNGKHRGSSHV